MNLIDSIQSTTPQPEVKNDDHNVIVQLVSDLKFLETQFKFFHWNTKSATEHKYYDEIVDGLGGFADSVAEIYLGMTGGKVPPMIQDQLADYQSKQEAINLLQTMMEYVMSFPEVPGSLKNLLDEIEGFLAKYVYLLSLNP